MPKRILVIDDSAVALAVASHALTEAGFGVETRSTLEEIAARPIENFDLILMDVQMPELFGDDIAMAFRYERDVKGLIYLFSTLDDDELAARARETGLDGFINKQAGPEHLVTEVRRILGV